MWSNERKYVAFNQIAIEIIVIVLYCGLGVMMILWKLCIDSHLEITP